MTYKEVFDMLEETDLPVVYHSWPIGNVPELPYIVFLYTNNNDLMADNINYQTIVELNIELYTQNKDFTTEATVESVLNSHNIAFSKEETWLDSEDMYQILYTTEVLITNGQ